MTRFAPISRFFDILVLCSLAALPACLAGGPGGSAAVPNGVFGASAPASVSGKNDTGADGLTPTATETPDTGANNIGAPALPSGVPGPLSESTPPLNPEGEGDVHLDAKLTRKNLGIVGRKIVLSGRVRCEDAEGNLYGCLAGRFLRIYDAAHSSYVDTKIGYAEGEPGFFDLSITVPAVPLVSQPVWSTDPENWTFQASPYLHQPPDEDTILKLDEPPVIAWTVLVVDSMQTLLPLQPVFRAVP